ncbi:MAG: protein kinase [Myxococcales bacterium]|nr:protein kinase [Myxococcales bacterium]
MRGYEVLRKLADGSTAEVFLAREESSQWSVVIEVLRPELTTDEEVYGRFLDEAKERQGLSHPNLLRLRSTGCAPDGRLFVVTEPVRGEHLGSWLAANGPLTLGELLKLIVPVCDALHYLHGRGLVHGHLRPANVFLTGPVSRPTPKLLDTGLTLFRGKRSVPVPSTVVLVAPEYLCPERILGARAGARSDVYGLGVLMFELLTGRPPFTSADPAETKRGHLGHAPPALPATCQRLAPVVYRCLAKDRARRYPDMASVRNALATIARELEARPRDVAVGPQLDAARFSTGSGPPPTGTRAAGPAASGLPPTGPRAADAPASGAGPAKATPSNELASTESADSLVVGEPVGEVLGSYELEDLLGQGGMGRVYLARHVKLGRRVALKVLKPELSSDPVHLRRFFQEARAVNRISHENIVEVHDFIEEPREQGGRVYFVMELLRGRTLRELMKEGPLPVRRAVRIIRQACDALQAAHQVGVVHRDVKPDNVFLTERAGQKDFVKVLDFGVAKLRGASEAGAINATSAGVVVGTPAYMSPEQALAEVVDHRADIYSLASVLYALLSGRPPFVEVSLGRLIARLVAQQPPPLPGSTPAGERIPEGLRSVVSRCLSKMPSERLQTMAELSAELEPFEAEPRQEAPREQPGTLEEELLRAPEPEPLVRRKRPGYRRGWWLVVLAGALLAALSLGAWALAGSRAVSFLKEPVSSGH